MSEITDPIPREHAACIVRAGATMKTIQDTDREVDALNLNALVAGCQTVMGTLETAGMQPNQSQRQRTLSWQYLSRNWCSDIHVRPASGSSVGGDCL